VRLERKEGRTAGLTRSREGAKKSAKQQISHEAAKAAIALCFSEILKNLAA
jgi:hypothetical protein